MDQVTPSTPAPNESIDQLLARINGIVGGTPVAPVAPEAPAPSQVAKPVVTQSPAELRQQAEGDKNTFWPKEPETIAEAGISSAAVEEIIMKYLLAIGEATIRSIATQVAMPFAYYVASVNAQTINDQSPSEEDLNRAFSDLLIDPQMMVKLGPAVNSGRGMFLFGYPGNGKTSIAERITAAFGPYVWIPRSITMDRDIVRVFDPMSHEECPLEEGDGLLSKDFDKRWVRIRRPTIVVGGELTMEQLEIQYNPQTGISEAPVQIKSNTGLLLIDDFGRQRMTVDELLNRWIVPLEKRYDFLTTSNGKSVQVPFDQLVVFSTNLEPKDLVDDAFLRRIPYKIEVPNPSVENFVKLFKIMCGVYKFEWKPELIQWLIQKHYLPTNRPLRNCHPRDLLLQVKNYCKYLKRPEVLSEEALDFACDNYFSIM